MKLSQVQIIWRWMADAGRIHGRGSSIVRGAGLLALGGFLVAGFAVAGDAPRTLKYGDGQAEGKQSLGGSGELIEFTLPARGEGVGRADSWFALRRGSGSG